MIKHALILFYLALSVCANASDLTETDKIHPAVGDVFTNPDFPKVLEISKTHLLAGEEGVRVGDAFTVTHAPNRKIGQRPYVEIAINIYPQTGGGCVTYSIGRVIADANANWISSNLRFDPAPADRSMSRCGSPPITHWLSRAQQETRPRDELPSKSSPKMTDFT